MKRVDFADELCTNGEDLDPVFFAIQPKQSRSGTVGSRNTVDCQCRNLLEKRGQILTWLLLPSTAML